MFPISPAGHRHARVTSMIKNMGGVAGIQLGHTGRNGSEVKPWIAGELGRQLSPEHPEGWQVMGPSDVPYGFGKRPYPVHPLTVDEIKTLHRRYADAARRAHDAGYEWLEMHSAHGYLAASFYSPLANPHRPVWAARELGHKDPFELVPEDWRWWLQNFRGHDPSIGWPEPADPAAEAPEVA